MKKKYGLFSQNIAAHDGAYDLGSADERQDTIYALTENSSVAKNAVSLYWKKMKRYYDGLHDINYTTDSFLSDMNIPWTPAQSTDGFVHVESQIYATPPDFEFSPYGEYSTEALKAREDMVRRVTEVNNLTELNMRSERRMGIYGSAVWKVSWGEVSSDYGKNDDVLIEIPHPGQIFTDPASDTVDGCEYVAYVYPMHSQKARRLFAKELEEKGCGFDEYLHSDRTGVVYEGAYDDENTVTITEFWFRQPYDSHEKSGESFKAGDIALCILVNGKEIRYTPKYWKNTDCDMYPFVISTKIPSEGSIWGKSELEMLIPLIDAADRELTFAQLNGAFCSNDIVLCEENAFADEALPDNSPGAVWKLRPGMMGKVQRLGNMGSAQGAQLNNYQAYQSMMEQTTGNFEVNQGKEPSRVTTASGIALLTERSKSRQSQKNAGRSEGFKRLYALIDKTCTEFYDDGRQIRCKDGAFEYSAGELCVSCGDVKIIPAVDIKIHVGDGIANSKAFTLSAVSSLMQMNISADNYIFAKAYVELAGLPMRGEICDFLDRKYAGDNQDESEIKEGDFLNEFFEKVV